jgi:hypothetical protein
MDFHNLMSRKGCCSKTFDTRRLVQHAIGEKINPDSSFKFSQFQSVMSRVFLKAALSNVLYYIKKVQKKGSTPSESLLQILNYQRSIVVDGLVKDQQTLGINAADIVSSIAKK